MADFVELLEILDGVQSGQLIADPSDFALHLQSHRGRFVNLLGYKVSDHAMRMEIVSICRGRRLVSLQDLP